MMRDASSVGPLRTVSPLRLSCVPPRELSSAWPDNMLEVSTFMHSQAPASLSPSIFTLVIEVYQARVYPVWPVLDAQVLLERLRAENDRDAYILTVALCCATMAQLNIAPIVHQGHEISSSWLERECCRMRAFSDFRSNPSIDGVLTSFFLHVYHAKADNRNAAMMYLQEGIALARLLRLDDCISPSATVSDNEKVHQDAIRNQIIYVLLWVSERSIHFSPIPPLK